MASWPLGPRHNLGNTTLISRRLGYPCNCPFCQTLRTTHYLCPRHVLSLCPALLECDRTSSRPEKHEHLIAGARAAPTVRGFLYREDATQLHFPFVFSFFFGSYKRFTHSLTHIELYYSRIKNIYHVSSSTTVLL